MNRTAYYVNSQGRADAGIADIRTTLEELLSLKGYMVSRNVFCIPFENIALLRAHFTLQTQDANGDPIQIEGHTSEIVRKQTDGSWLYIVDHPFGADVLERARVL